MAGSLPTFPLKVNQAGVIPVIFASSVLTFPLTLAQFIPAVDVINRWVGYGSFGYNVLYVVLVVFFTYFYTAVTFNPTEVATNMKKNGGYIPGLRPGKPTSDFLDRILSRITLPGAFFLAGNCRSAICCWCSNQDSFQHSVFRRYWNPDYCRCGT
jgi:preprotein translocase subunit SecY